MRIIISPSLSALVYGPHLVPVRRLSALPAGAHRCVFVVQVSKFIGGVKEKGC